MLKRNANFSENSKLLHKLTNFQTYKLTNLQTCKLTNLQTHKLTNCPFSTCWFLKLLVWALCPFSTCWFLYELFKWKAVMIMGSKSRSKSQFRQFSFSVSEFNKQKKMSFWRQQTAGGFATTKRRVLGDTKGLLREAWTKRKVLRTNCCTQSWNLEVGNRVSNVW